MRSKIILSVFCIIMQLHSVSQNSKFETFKLNRQAEFKKYKTERLIRFNSFRNEVYGNMPTKPSELDKNNSGEVEPIRIISKAEPIILETKVEKHNLETSEETKDSAIITLELENYSKNSTLLKSPINKGWNSLLSSPFGMRFHPILRYNAMHKGIDIACPLNTPIISSADGIVKKTGKNLGYGNYIVIDHGETETFYSHLNSIKVEKKQHVKQGEVIGLSGNTGLSTGPHLHYEVLVEGKHVDPELFIDL